MERLIYLFKIYLATQNISPTSRKNYLIDLRNFLEWFILHLKTNKVEFDEANPGSLASLVNKEKVEGYKTFLINNRTPAKTINRRLSSLRHFGSFAITQGWQNINPAREIPNLGTKPHQKLNQEELILTEFRKDLEKEGVTPITVKNYIVDTRQFLRFLTLFSILLIILLPSNKAIKIYSTMSLSSSYQGSI